MTASAAPKNISARLALIIVLIVLVLVAAIYFSGRKAGKNKAAADKWGKSDWGSGLKTNPSQIPHGWTPDGLAKELFDAMDGIMTWGSTKEKAWAKLTALTDAQVIEVWKLFNERYADKSEAETLTTWIKDEVNGDNKAVLAVLSKLNLP